MTDELTRETRDIIVLALDILIEQLEAERRESTYSAITARRLKAARAARDEINDR